jgi:hypothetical protein
MVTNLHPNTTGDIGESLLLAELVLRGLNVSIPFGHNTLYDLVAEHYRSKKLLKVQIKNRTSISGNCIRISNIDKYIGAVDVMAILIGSDWYFVGGRTLYKYAGRSNLMMNELGVKNKFSIFGV